MSRPYITIVTGMGRCGTSLVMKMLDKGGISPFHAAAPGYENIKIRDAMAKGDYSWCDPAKGHTVKVLEPYKYRLPCRSVAECRVIWLGRDLEAQAESWRRYTIRRGVARRKAHPVMHEEKWLKEERNYLKTGRRKSMLALGRTGQEHCANSLEGIQGHPGPWSALMSSFLGGGLDEHAMALCVLPKEQRGEVPA